MRYSNNLYKILIFGVMACRAADHHEQEQNSYSESYKFKMLVGGLSYCESALNFFQYYKLTDNETPDYALMAWGLLPSMGIAGAGCYFGWLGRQPQESTQHTNAHFPIAQNYRDTAKICCGLSLGVITSFLSLNMPHAKIANLIGGITSCGIPTYIWLKNSKDRLRGYIPCLRRNTPLNADMVA